MYDERIFLFCVAFNFSFLNIEFSTYSYRLSRTLLRPRRRRRQRDFLFYSFFHRFFFFFFPLSREISRETIDRRFVICGAFFFVSFFFLNIVLILHLPYFLWPATLSLLAVFLESETVVRRRMNRKINGCDIYFAEAGKFPETVGGSICQRGQRQKGRVRGEFLETELQTEMVLPKGRKFYLLYHFLLPFHSLKHFPPFLPGAVPFVEIQVQERGRLLPAHHHEPQGRGHRKVHDRNFRCLEHCLPQRRRLVI